MPEDQRQPLTGVWIQTPCYWACEIAAAVGYDAVFLDGEHGTLNTETLDRLASLSRALGLLVYWRVRTAERDPIQQALDAGADALVLPQIRDLAHARRSAAFAKYPPGGTRGMGLPRSLNYYDTPADFVETENRRTKSFVMVETPGALADAEAIAALPAVDGLFMGPYDLSLTTGRGQYAMTEPDKADADAIARAATSAGKLLGMPAFSDTDLRQAVSYGAHIVTVGDDISALRECLAGSLRKARLILGAKV